MILTILAFIVIAIGVVMMFKGNNDEVEFTGLVLTVAGVIMAFVLVCLIIGAHAGVDVQIEQNRIEYEALCERLEIANSDYEDISKSDVVKDVADWNKNVYSYKYWSRNPWTNWFYSTRVADELEVIERGQDEVTR